MVMVLGLELLLRVHFLTLHIKILVESDLNFMSHVNVKFDPIFELLS